MDTKTCPICSKPLTHYATTKTVPEWWFHRNPDCPADDTQLFAGELALLRRVKAHYENKTTHYCSAANRRR